MTSLLYLSRAHFVFQSYRCNSRIGYYCLPILFTSGLRFLIRLHIALIDILETRFRRDDAKWNHISISHPPYGAAFWCVL